MKAALDGPGVALIDHALQLGGNGERGGIGFVHVFAVDDSVERVRERGRGHCLIYDLMLVLILRFIVPVPDLHQTTTTTTCFHEVIYVSPSCRVNYMS